MRSVLELSAANAFETLDATGAARSSRYAYDRRRPELGTLSLKCPFKDANVAIDLDPLSLLVPSCECGAPATHPSSQVRWGSSALP